MSAILCLISVYDKWSVLLTLKTPVLPVEESNLIYSDTVGLDFMLDQDNLLGDVPRPNTENICGPKGIRTLLSDFSVPG